MLKYPKKSLLFAPSQGKKGARIEYLVDVIWRTDERVKAAQKKISKCIFLNEVVNTVKIARDTYR